MKTYFRFLKNWFLFLWFYAIKKGEWKHGWPTFSQMKIIEDTERKVKNGEIKEIYPELGGS